MKHQAPLLWSFPSQKSNYQPKFHRVSGGGKEGKGDDANVLHNTPGGT